MKTALMDASSSILLYKAGMLDGVAENYTVIMPRSVFDEITVPGYPGDRVFTSLCSKGMIHVVENHTSTPPAPQSMGRGEHDTISLYSGYPQAFIIIDDGKGARYCRHQNIPYINALLVPKILFYSGRLDEKGYCKATNRLIRLGRYSAWIVDYAKDCTPDKLTFFLCEATHDSDAYFPG